ncbi:MAG: hypothetical protein KJ646_02150 [Nanoarchaeota archaeon]|nr:hypothetical protein [Nanoarchaeota archaeon]MBU4116942.1 hypothetical protein [Nanoarchaeota archaeon]
MKQKGNAKGQFYLLAAVILVSMIVGFIAISNYSKQSSSIKLYDLGKELEIESVRVLDYGVYNTFDEVRMANLLQGFIELYSDYGGEVEKIIFIFGNTNNITVMGYQDLQDETILVEIGEISASLVLNQGQTSSETYELSGSSTVIIVVNGVEYKFELNPGENFYFIIAQEIEGEEYVVVGGGGKYKEK